MTVFGFLSTYPPTRCGLATFTEALAAEMPTPADHDSRVVRVDDLVPTGPPLLGARTEVVGDLHPGELASRVAAAAALNACDVVFVQHEYGIYGGRDGDEILDLLVRLTVPCVVTLHTVRESPTAHQRWLLDRIGGLASAVVVMTSAARDLLARSYSIAPSKVHVIPHGVGAWSPPSAAPRGPRQTIVTWGLLGPGKGIEWGIRALAEPTALHPSPRYLVVGQTHPKVLSASGEAYRESLVELARDLGVESDVEFVGRYLEARELAEIVASADVVLLPYDSREQTTSGVLAEAVAAGKPVIATRFPHAVELLSGGAGILVEQGSPGEIADALSRILGRQEVAIGMANAAHDESRESSWEAVAEKYRSVATVLLRANAA